MPILERIKSDVIAGHEIAIDNCITAIADLIPLHHGNPAIDRQINHQVSVLRILIKEWKEIK
jgi:hypothetical protein